jgi:hypothetical protein
MIDVEELAKECECRAAANTGEERRFFLKLVYILDDYIKDGKFLDAILKELKELSDGMDRR